MNLVLVKMRRINLVIQEACTAAEATERELAHATEAADVARSAIQSAERELHRVESNGAGAWTNGEVAYSQHIQDTKQRIRASQQAYRAASVDLINVQAKHDRAQQEVQV